MDHSRDSDMLDLQSEQFPTELNSNYPCHCEPTGRREASPEDRLREAISGKQPLVRSEIASSRDALLAMTALFVIRMNEFNLIGNRSRLRRLRSR
jgi:hypothetical protein